MANRTPAKKRTGKRTPVSPKEREVMLYWYTFYEGNASRTARKVSSLTGIPRSRKVVADVAKRYNFATLSHVVRDRVNKHFFNDDTPGMGRLLKIASDMLECDEELLLEVKKFLRGDRSSKVENIKEVLDILKYTNTSLGQLSGSKDFKEESFTKIAEKEGPKLDATLQDILAEMDPNEREEFQEIIVNKQIERILKHKGEESKFKGGTKL